MFGDRCNNSLMIPTISRNTLHASRLLFSIGLIAPLNLLERSKQLAPALGMQLSHKSNPTAQVRMEIGVLVAVLFLRTVFDAVVDHCFQLVILVAADTGPRIHYNAGQLLPNALTHESRLARVDFKAFLQGDACDVDLEAPGTTLQELAAGKCQIIGIAGIARFYRACQTS